jgi:dTDP-4-amino-4,6-dideoxy-D-galactose acyltransferase
MDSPAVCDCLEWDSQFFGRRIARVAAARLTKELIAEIDGWCAVHKVECLYFLADSSDQATVRLAHDNTFRLVDIRLTLNFQIGAFDENRTDHFPVAVRDAIESDIPALRELAGSGHRDSRFYYDGNFSIQKCDELYETWIEKSCRGWAQKVIVADRGHGAEGYLTCHLIDSEGGQIGLVGIAKQARGLGIGGCLVRQAVHWFAQKGVENVSIVTQGRNVSAQRLYQKCGFATRSVELWFHKWFTETGEKG